MVKDKTTPLHLHPGAREMTYVIDGEIEVQVDGKRDGVRSGGMSFVPKAVTHAFIVVSAEARRIPLQTPGAVGQAFSRGGSEPSRRHDPRTTQRSWLPKPDVLPTPSLIRQLPAQVVCQRRLHERVLGHVRGKVPSALQVTDLPPGEWSSGPVRADKRCAYLPLCAASASRRWFRQTVRQ